MTNIITRPAWKVSDEYIRLRWIMFFIGEYFAINIFSMIKKYKHFTDNFWMSMSEYLYFWRISGENVILPLIPAIVSCNWNKWINGKLTLVWWSLLLFMFLIVSHFLSCLGFTAILGSYQNILQFWARNAKWIPNIFLPPELW